MALLGEIGDTGRFRSADTFAALAEVFYSRIRRHSGIGYLSPDQFEERYRSSPAVEAV